MDLLYWKLGPRRFREGSGDGGDGGDGSGDGDGDGGSGGANGDGSGGGGNGPGGNGGPGDGTGDGSNGGADGVGDGVSGDGEGGVAGDDNGGFGSDYGMSDFGVADFGVPDVASYDMSLGIPSLAETTVTAEDESSSPDWGGVASNVGLRGLAAVTGLPIGLMRGLAAVMNGNTSTATQTSIINSILGLTPLGPVNGLAGLFGYDVGTAVSGMPGVAANSVGPGPSGASQEIWGSGGNLAGSPFSGSDSNGGFGLTSSFGSGAAGSFLANLGDNNLSSLWNTMKINNKVVDDGFLKKLMETGGRNG